MRLWKYIENGVKAKKNQAKNNSAFNVVKELNKCTL